MRYDPTGTAIAYTHGYGGGGLTIRITDRAGAVLATLPGGHEPEWFDPTTLYARSLDGGQSDHDVGPYRLHLLGANEGDLSAAVDTVAVAASRSSGVRVMGPLTVGHFPGTFEPSLSGGGTLALRNSATGVLHLERLPGCVDVAPLDPVLGPGTRARWSSQTVVWDAIPFGRVYGRSTPNVLTVELTIPGRACSHPIALWTGVRLYIGLVLDDGALVVCDWGSLVRRESLGWRVGVSGGAGFDWDLANSLDGPRVAYLTPEGTLATALVDISAAPVSLAPDVHPPDPKPPDPKPPDPKPPDPKPPTPGGIVITFPELRNMEMRLEDTYHNHGHHPPMTYTIHVNPEGFVWRQHYWDRRAAGMDHESAIRSIESDIDTIEGRPDRWAPPPVEPGTLHGPIGVEGRGFTVPG